jgi:hypothetical protein
LPSTSEGEDDSPYFEDDQALLKWMEVDPERNRPTYVPNKRLVETPKVDTGMLYPDPDFDAIFGEEEGSSPVVASAPPPTSTELPSRIMPAAAQTTQTLDDLFQSEDPQFDDLFGEALIPQEAAPAPAALEALAIPDSYPLPGTDELLMQADNVVYDDVPQEMFDPIMPEDEQADMAEPVDDLPYMEMEFQSRDLPDEPTMPLPQESELPPLDDLLDFTAQTELTDWQDPKRSTLPLPPQAVEPNRADHYATIEAPTIPSEAAYFETPDLPTEEDEPDTAIGFTQTDLEVPVTDDPFLAQEAPATPYFDDESTEILAKTVPQPAQESLPEEDFEALEEVEDYVAQYGDATDILTENFYAEQESHPALNLLDQMTNAITTQEMEAADYWVDEPEPLRQDPSASNFVQMLEREAAESGQYDPADFAPEEDMIASIAYQLGDLEEALPLAEVAARPVDLRNANLRYSGFDKLNPHEPEVLPGGQEVELVAPPLEEATNYPLEESTGGGSEFEPIPEPVEATRSADSGALINSTASPALTPKVVRPSAEALFRPSELTPDRELVGMLVDDNRLRELFEQIEALHEDIVQNVRGDRGNSDVYQEELVYASNLLLSSRDHYDEARGIVYRIRADLNRERRVEEDLRKFRPTLTLIYALLLVAIGILLLMGGFFSDVAEGLGAGWVAQGYYPALAGMLGAWIAGLMSLWQSSNERTFDSLNVNQYLWKPLMGLVSGFIAYLFLAAPSAATLDSTVASEVARSPFTIIVALAFGLFQDAVINALSNALGRVLPSNATSDDQPLPPARNR